VWLADELHQPAEGNFMKILIACEYSGIVRDAFSALGHDAMSCDLLPTESPGRHYQGDVFGIINDGWDMMIAHPPCTYLCSSGLHWNKKRPERELQTISSIAFVERLINANIPKIAIENPIGRISTAIRKPDQIIQPWQFGHGETKATCLWLKNLPKLTLTNIVDGRVGRVWKMPQSLERWKERSRTFTGIAVAMAAQWGQ
jgi:hypothetical protein